MEENNWIQSEIARQTAEHGSVPPPWIAFPDTHPYDIGWRMGPGESHVMVWRTWWDAQQLDEPQRINYFHRWPPPPRWLAWMIDAIWNIEPTGDDDIDDQERSPYYNRAQALGFTTHSDYDKDLNDPKWLE